TEAGAAGFDAAGAGGGAATFAPLLAAPFIAAVKVAEQSGHLIALPTRFSATVRLRLHEVQAIAGMISPSQGLRHDAGGETTLSPAEFPENVLKSYWRARRG